MRGFFTDRTPPDEAGMKAVYDRYAPHWRERIGWVESRLTSSAWRNALVGELHGDVLELGIGAGDTLVRLRDYGDNVTSYTGIDLSPGMIAEAQRLVNSITTPVTLIEGDAQDLSRFPDHSFDTVTASLVFCTIPDVPRTLAEIARVLKPEGRYVGIEHVLSPNPLAARAQIIAAPLQIRHMGCHLDRNTIKTFQDNGYIIERHWRRVFGIMRFFVATPPR